MKAKKTKFTVDQFYNFKLDCDYYRIDVRINSESACRKYYITINVSSLYGNMYAVANSVELSDAKELSEINKFISSRWAIIAKRINMASIHSGHVIDAILSYDFLLPNHLISTEIISHKSRDEFRRLESTHRAKMLSEELTRFNESNQSNQSNQ